MAHAYILKNKSFAFGVALGMTIVLGIIFLACQGYEYSNGIKFS